MLVCIPEVLDWTELKKIRAAKRRVRPGRSIDPPDPAVSSGRRRGALCRLFPDGPAGRRDDGINPRWVI